MAKKASGGGWGFILLVVIGAIASVPAEIWIGLGVFAGIWFLFHVFNKSGPEQSATSAPREVTRDSPRPAPSVSVQISYGGSGARPDSKLTSAQCWVPPDQEFTIGGRVIPGGMVYVGSRLPAINAYEVEPAAIDPKLPVNRVGAASRMPYWPSYSEISPEARGEYQDWLAGGRRDPNVQIGCVFLFLYGLERRALFDARSMESVVSAEMPAMIVEIERLLSLFASVGSFQGYGSGLLDMLNFISAPSRKLYDLDPQKVIPTGGRRVQMSHKLALGQAARDGIPLSGAWAYSWLTHDEMTSLRTPATRCPEEFRRLFLAMYNQKYGQGMTLPVNKTRLKLTYRPASASFPGRLEHETGDIPDITVLERPIGALRELANEAAESLDDYSRFIGRNSEKRDSMDAVVLLPPLLWPRDSMVSLGTWLKQLNVEREMQATSLSKLMRHFPEWGVINRDRAAAFASAVEHFGVGMEPDVRWGGPVPNEAAPVVLFAIPAEERGKKPTSVYAAAALTMHLAASVSAADGVAAEEERYLEESLEQLLHLAAHERLRLRAHVKWLLLAKPSLTAMKRRISGLDTSQREAIGAFAVNAAQSQGGLTPAEMKSLTKIYRLLNLSEERLFSTAHAAATAPVTVQPAKKTAKKFAIPKPPAQPSSAPLDAARITQLTEESARVSAILTTIFSEGNETLVPVEPEPEQATEPNSSPVGLDRESSDFVAVLVGRDSWARQELEDLASDRGIMLDGALERVNEAYMDKYGEPLLEGDDPVVINKNVLKELQPA